MSSTIRIKRTTTSNRPSSLANSELAMIEGSQTLVIGIGTGGESGSATSIVDVGGTGAFLGLSNALTQTAAGSYTFSGSVTMSGAASLGAATATSPAASDDSTRVATTAWVQDEIASLGTGSVTSVGLSLPDIFTVSGSPVTTSGTLSATLSSQSPNVVLAGPTSGAGAAPAFRSLVAADIPDLSSSYLSLTGTQTASGSYTITGSVSLGSNATATTPATGDNSTAVATTAFVKGQNYLTAETYTGTVTSVALSLPGIFSVSGSPITSSGTLSASLSSQTQGHIFAAPTSGNGTPSFRAIVTGDLPDLSASYLPISGGSLTGNLSVGGDLTVSGTCTINGDTVTVNATTLTVDDKTIELGSVYSPSDSTADGGGVVLKGSTDHTILWVNATDSWNFSEHVNLSSGKEYRINGSSVLTSSSLGGGVTSSSLQSVGTLTQGTWNANAIGVGYGGTGLSSAPQGSVLVANSANTMTALDGGGSTDKLLLYSAASDTISWTSEIDGGSF